MKKPFRVYYEEFCENFGHPLWHMPMMFIGVFFMIEVMHISEHNNVMGDAHGYCGQKEWVRELKQYKEDNMY